MHTPRGEVAIAILAEELADQYKRMAASHRDMHRRALLRVAAEILEVLASEIVAGTLNASTIERLEAVVSFLRRNYLPYRKIQRLARLARELAYAPGGHGYYGTVQFDRLNTTLS